MRTKHIVIVLLALTTNVYCWAQDSSLDRVVTVERDYQPEIQQATKIQLTPEILKEEVEPNPVVYSTYSTPLSVEYNLHPLQAAKTQFNPQPTYNGLVEAAVGHRNTHLLFGYQIRHKKKMSLNLYANHDAHWGRDALSKSLLGMQVTSHFLEADLYFGVAANNDYYTYYGKYFDGNKNLTIARGQSVEGQTLWDITTKIGLKSTADNPFKYHIQTGYSAYIIPRYIVEHQVRSYIDLTWSNDTHGAGIKAHVQNNLYALEKDSTCLHKHAMRIEPFYAFQSDNIRLHVGVNLDLNVGTGKQISTLENVSFAPSPNVEFEWNMMDNIFHLYTIAQGSYGIGSVEEYLNYIRYLNIEQGIAFNTPRAYTPVDAQLGFKIRPIKTMLIDIYGGYAYRIGACHMEAVQQDNSPSVQEYKLWTNNEQQWKVGAKLHYHYKDILTVNLAGNYYFYPMNPIPSMDPSSPNFQEARIKGTTTFDRPNWDAYARIDAHIDSKWSVYSENYFAGSRWAYVAKDKQQLKPTISLNIGGQYTFNNWLHVYLQLNNYLNRKNDIFYGYQSQGCHFLLGARYKF